MRLGRWAIIGLLVALRLFVADTGAREARWRQLSEQMLSQLKAIGRLEATLVSDARESGIPYVAVRGRDAAINMRALAWKLEAGTPRVCCNISRAGDGVLLLSPVCLREDQLPALAQAFRAALA